MTPKRILDELDHLEQLHQRNNTDMLYKIARLRNIVTQSPTLPTKAKVKQMAAEAGAKRRQRIINQQQP